MKTAMKSAAKAAATALAVVTVLLALSCAPVVELTEPDWGTRDEARSSEYTGGTHSFGTAIQVAANTTYGGLKFGSNEPDVNREIKVTFNSYANSAYTADVLNESNDNIAGKMKEFLKFYTYTSAVDHSDGTKRATDYTPSTQVTVYDYDFVERTGTNANEITIRLKSVPDAQRIAYKIDASKYTESGGRTVDFNGDYEAGTVYDDQYGTLNITGFTSAMTPTSTFYAPVQNVTVIADFSPSTTFTAANSDTIWLDSPISFNNFTGSYAQTNAILKEVNTAYKPEIQKYDTVKQEWVDAGATFGVFEYNGPTGSYTSPGGGLPTTSSYIYASFKPEDAGIYRLKLSDTKVRLSAANIGEKPAKIIFGTRGDGLTATATTTPPRPDDAAALQNTYYSTSTIINETTKSGNASNWAADFPFDTTWEDVKVRTDASLKNVVLEVPLSITQGSKYIDTLSTEAFNKAVSIVYYDGYNAPTNYFGTNSNPDKWKEVTVTKVEWKADHRASATNADTNLLVITLDPGYQLAGTRDYHILINKGLSYKGTATDPAKVIYFGDASNIKRYKDSFFWKDYGRIYFSEAEAVYVELDEGDWKDNWWIGVGDTYNYQFTPTVNTWYYIFWIDNYNRNGVQDPYTGQTIGTFDGTARVKVTVSYNEGQNSSSWDYYYGNSGGSFRPTMNGPVTVTVTGIQQGSFSIVISTNNNNPRGHW